jgi:dipeptidyl aminopeptidase/acylaminoacyl peptidase
MAFNMASGEARELGPGKEAFYSSGGYLIHGPGALSGEGLWALPFSSATLQVTGEDFPISTSGSAASVSRDGAMAYSDSRNTQMSRKTLVWRNRTGEIVETVGQPQPGLREFSLSPDGRWVATTADEPSDIWIQDLARSTVTRLTFDPGPEYITSWTASGREVAYTQASAVQGSGRITLKAADGTGEASVLADIGLTQSNADWSRDGRFVVFSGPSAADKKSDIFFIELDKTGDARKPKVFLSTPASENVAKLSPDGRFVAYVSDESGKAEIYIRPFLSGDGRWQASVNGGKQPRWRRDGKELFYVENDTRLMAASVTAAGEGLALGQPQGLFESPDLNFRGLSWPQYDVSPDGQRFLTSTLVDPDAAPTMRVVLNWFEPFRNRPQQ